MCFSKQYPQPSTTFPIQNWHNLILHSIYNPSPVDEELLLQSGPEIEKEKMEMCVPWEWKTNQETGGSFTELDHPPTHNWTPSSPINENPVIQP